MTKKKHKPRYNIARRALKFGTSVASTMFKVSAKSVGKINNLSIEFSYNGFKLLGNQAFLNGGIDALQMALVSLSEMRQDKCFESDSERLDTLEGELEIILMELSNAILVSLEKPEKYSLEDIKKSKSKWSILLIDKLLDVDTKEKRLHEIKWIKRWPKIKTTC